MTSNEQDTFDSLLLGRNGPPAFKFSTFGDFVEGTLTGKDTQQKAKFNPKEPGDRSELLFFKSGDPITELILTLQTDLRDATKDNDKGLRRVFVSSLVMQQALQKAVADAGIKKSLPFGTKIKITYTHETPVAGTSNSRKEYSVVVTPVADQLINAPVETRTAVQPPVAGNDLSPQLIQLAREAGIPVPGE